jgi:hypothetical protein
VGLGGEVGSQTSGASCLLDEGLMLSSMTSPPGSGVVLEGIGVAGVLPFEIKMISQKRRVIKRRLKFQEEGQIPGREWCTCATSSLGGTAQGSGLAC